jgi:ribonuclease HII
MGRPSGAGWPVSRRRPAEAEILSLFPSTLRLLPGGEAGAAGSPRATRVAGVDEAGRGSLAGPVVAAAVVLPAGARIPGLADSKLLSPTVRTRLAEEIAAVATAWAVTAVEAAEIDATDILRATFRAMAVAVAELSPRPGLVLVDGSLLPRLPLPARAIVKGDRTVPAISAASILAKVARDRIMEGWASRFPAYGFAQHKGYGTAGHRAAIARYGPSPIHRRTFAGVREFAGGGAEQGCLW